MCDSLKEEFSCSHFALRFHKAEAFCEAQWKWPRIVFVLYRVVMSAYSIFAFTHMLVTTTDAPLHITVYLTVWTYFVETLFFSMGAVLAIFFFLRPAHFKATRPGGGGGGGGGGDRLHSQDNEAFDGVAMNGTDHGNGWSGHGTTTTTTTTNTAITLNNSPPPNGVFSLTAANGSRHETHNGSSNGVSALGGHNNQAWREHNGSSDTHNDGDLSLPWYIQLYWFLSNVIHVFAFVVTIIYFGALYRPAGGQAINLADLDVHGISSVMVLVDLLVCARPVRILHALFPTVYGSVYVVFSAIFWSQDHSRNVMYPNVLDWNQPGSTVAVVAGLALVGIPLVQLANWGLYKLRLCVYRKMYGHSYQ